MAISRVQLANRALQKLGAKRIESLTQDHPNARSMNAAFEWGPFLVPVALVVVGLLILKGKK